MVETVSFPDPYEIPPPDGCDGWQEMYPYYVLFDEGRRHVDAERFWIYNGVHFPEPMSPFDLCTAEAPYLSIGNYNSRIFAVPPAMGLDFRVVNGYIYIAGVPVTDRDEVARRAQIFGERASFYYENWDRLYEKWRQKVTDVIARLQTIQVPRLPDIEDASVVTEARGIGQSYDLLVAWNRTLELIHEIWHLHFEFLILGQFAYLSFFELCREYFPDVSDQNVAQMVAGLEKNPMLRGDDELRRLARLAVEMDLDGPLTSGRGVEETFAELRQSVGGQRWLQEFEAAREPWFNLSTHDGFQHQHRSWNDDLRLPLAGIADYITRLLAGESLERPLEDVKARQDRIANGYRELLHSEEDRAAFDAALGLARLVFPHLEEHKFYVEHWFHCLFWNKVREFGRLFVRFGFFDHEDDIFTLHHSDAAKALMDLSLSWTAGSTPAGPTYWRPIVRRRKEILRGLQEWKPVPALGKAPPDITDPLLLMFWGVSPDSVREWGKSTEVDTMLLQGAAASPGVVEGTARVVRAVEDIHTVQDGEILVCPVTSPAWGPVFTKIKAAVSDAGGIMSHAAIVAREYGLPAVVGTGRATNVIKTGQTIRVDGTKGTVEVLG